MNNCVVLIPHHKYDLIYLEKLSLNRIYDVFDNMQCYLILPSYINANKFIDINLDKNVKDKYLLYHDNFDYMYFDDKWFNSAAANNSLMLTKNIYIPFKELGFDYMLIAQLDAFVFHNDIDNYLNKNYDFIGSYLFTCLDSWYIDKIIEEYPNHYLTHQIILNGGFSLRNIDFCILTIEYYTPWLQDTVIKEGLDNNYILIGEDDFFSQNVKNIAEPLDIFRFAISGNNIVKCHFLINYEYPMAIHAILDEEKNKYAQFLINNFLKENNISYII